MRNSIFNPEVYSIKSCPETNSYSVVLHSSNYGFAAAAQKKQVGFEVNIQDLGAPFRIEISIQLNDAKNFKVNDSDFRHALALANDYSLIGLKDLNTILFKYDLYLKNKLNCLIENKIHAHESDYSGSHFAF